MKDVTKVWDKHCEDALESMVNIFRRSVISDAESFATFRNQNNITAQGLEIALFKSVMTLNESNKAVMFKRLGLVEATSLIKSLEDRAIADVSMSVIEELEENYDNLPPELQEIINLIKDKLREEGNKET